MIISLEAGADPKAVQRALVARGLWVSQVERTTSGAPVHYVISPHSAALSHAEIAAIDGVARVTTAESPFPLVQRQGPVVDVGGVRVGAPRAEGRPALMCGPCSIESEDHIHAAAAHLAPLGVAFLRGGAFKPRTSPYAFQGHGEPALGWMRRAADTFGMKVVTEVLSEGDVEIVAAHADLVQVGSRNMQNFALLRAIGKTGRPALLKRGLAATIEEWLMAGEYLLAAGSTGVIFCERGIRSHDGATRNLLDLGAVALLSHVHRLPVIVDPSHATGRRDLILPLSRAALASGAVGLMIETHDDPGRALSDGPQAVPLVEMAALLREVSEYPENARPSAGGRP